MKLSKRFFAIENGLLVFCTFNFIFDLVNEKLLFSLFSIEFIKYSFWLSLGLYLGFKWCKFELLKNYKGLS